MESALSHPRVLVIGFGNPGRVDDGLGPALADRVADLDLPEVSTEAFYQLSVEDSLDVALADVVVFADATVDTSRSFDLVRLEADPSPSFTSHAVHPAGVLALAESVHGARPDAWLLTIRGYEFDRFEEALSVGAQADLEAALRFLVPLLEAHDIQAFHAAADSLAAARQPA